MLCDITVNPQWIFCLGVSALQFVRTFAQLEDFGARPVPGRQQPWLPGRCRLSEPWWRYNPLRAGTSPRSFGCGYAALGPLR